ncbi:hypothetical protein AN639_04785 [Candidatus Epulonipiscium fishelsonii]|uniref:Uncharacterized protein n=1 Tax=Candidatus Epulonipiscium fishelsonii TaxID=77094 RepID=A0ACC8XD04_9FIRM|nr:hypothetical protein AN639_04785 [Epulopiscium sp. SCG-B05WGA-EpuloA1]ONI40795.1 hypothetical protein AN396_05090 [Epulopiscium sp. SCG-B11WGA-EpuloA1]
MKTINSILLLICISTNVSATEYLTSSWKMPTSKSEIANASSGILSSKSKGHNLEISSSFFSPSSIFSSNTDKDSNTTKSNADKSDDTKSSNADKSNDTKSITLPFEYNAMPYKYTSKERELLDQKLEELKRYSKNDFGSDIYRTISVPYFPQENGYYCAPATIKQIMHYFNGTSYDQSDIAESLYTTTVGTDMTYLHKYLNIVTDEQYIYHEKATKDFYEWLDIIIYNIMNDKPVILDVTIKEKGTFPYITSGHFLNISGVDTKNQRLRLTDPNSIHGGNIWYDWTDVYNINNAHFRQAIVW